MSEQKNYTANADGWIAGKRVSKGDPLKLDTSQAKYENVTPDKSKDRADADAAKTAAREQSAKASASSAKK